MKYFLLFGLRAVTLMALAHGWASAQGQDADRWMVEVPVRVLQQSHVPLLELDEELSRELITLLELSGEQMRLLTQVFKQTREAILDQMLASADVVVAQPGHVELRFPPFNEAYQQRMAELEESVNGIIGDENQRILKALSAYYQREGVTYRMVDGEMVEDEFGRFGNHLADVIMPVDFNRFQDELLTEGIDVSIKHRVTKNGKDRWSMTCSVADGSSIKSPAAQLRKSSQDFYTRVLKQFGDQVE